MTDIFSKVKAVEQAMISDRRYLHQHAEIGFDLPETTAYIRNILKNIGCDVFECGKSGVYTVIGDKDEEPCILLRADIDALPITEKSGERFSSSENMHACGHDLHTAMLLGTARVLKSCENELSRPVKLLFQPAEEILAGAKNMIENGILEAPRVDAAFMLHVITNTPLPTGTLVISLPGVSAPSSDYFEIDVEGIGCHGAMPNTGVDPIIAAAHIITSLDTIKARELSLYDGAVVTIGSVNAGNVHNVIPDRAIIKGTCRAFDEDIRKLLKDGIVRISENSAKALRSSATVAFPKGCPCLFNDEKLSETAEKVLKKAFHTNMVVTSREALEKSGVAQRSSGSEDFAYYSQAVPSLMIGISAGSSRDGYDTPLHHPKTLFDEGALIYGAAAFCEIALNM